MAQSTANYTFTSATNGSFTDMSSGTLPLVAGSQDNTSSIPASNIGFTFYYMGQPYTTFSASSNGLVRLGSVVTTTTYAVAQSSTALLSPFGRDLATHSTGGVRYKITGTSPNQVLTIEWYNMEIDNSSTTADGTFQLKLYENNNSIEFVYGTMYVSAAISNNFSIGFSSSQYRQ